MNQYRKNLDYFGIENVALLSEEKDLNKLIGVKNIIHRRIESNTEKMEDLTEKRRIDGSYIDNSLFSLVRNKRLETVQAAEDTYTLEISNKFYSQLLTTKVKFALDKKINLLRSLSFLYKARLEDLVFMANLMIEKKFKLGERIFEKDSFPKELMLISKGICKILWIAKVVRPNKPKIETIRRHNPLQPFLYSKFVVKKEKPISEKKYFPRSKLKFNYENIKIESDNSHAYEQHYCIKELRPGDHLGLRSMLIAKPEDEGKFFEGIKQKIKFDIISDSQEFIVFSFPIAFFRFLSQDLQVIKF